MFSKWLSVVALAFFWVTSGFAQAPDSLPGCQYNSTPLALSSGQTAAWQCDQNGRLITSSPGAPINVASYLTAAQLAIVQAGTNTTDVGAAIASAITTCNASATAACGFYFPAGYYYDLSCNRTLTKPFTVRGDGARSLANTQGVSTVSCGTNGVPLFTASNAMIGLFKDIALLSVGFTPAASSSAVLVTNSTTLTASISGTTMTVTAQSGAPLAIFSPVTGAGVTASTSITALGTGTGGTGTYTVNNSQSIASEAMTASNVYQKVDFENVVFDGFYDTIDIAVGNSWHFTDSVAQNCVHWCMRVRNTALSDAGDWTISNNSFYPATGGLAAVRMESSGGGKIIGNQIVGNNGNIVDCINIDVTGNTGSQQTDISGNKCEGTTGIPINIVRGWTLMKISNNTIKSAVSNIIQPAIYCLNCANTIIEGNTGYGTGNAITLVSASYTTVGCNQFNFQSLLINTTPGTNVTVNTACNLSPTFYQGPGDIKAGATAFWGLRSYTVATAGSRVANICNAADATCADVSSLSNGAFDVLTARSAPLLCGGAGGTCTIKTLYDQTLGSACAGVCNITNATIGTRPTLTFNCQGGLPCMTSTTATGVNPTIANSSIAQPFTITAMARRTANFTVYNTILTNAAGNVGLFFKTTGQANLLVNGVDHDFAAANTSWHALQGVYNGASSSGTADGTTTAISAAATALTSAALIRSFNDTSAPGDALVGDVTEMGIWSSAFTTTELTLMNTNIHNFWAF